MGELSTNPPTVPFHVVPGPCPLPSVCCQLWSRASTLIRLRLWVPSAMELVAMKQRSWFFPKHLSGFLISHIRRRKKKCVLQWLVVHLLILAWCWKSCQGRWSTLPYSLLILSIAAYGIKLLSQRPQGKCSVLTNSKLQNRKSAGAILQHRLQGAVYALYREQLILGYISLELINSEEQKELAGVNIHHARGKEFFPKWGANTASSLNSLLSNNAKTI